MTEIAMHIPSFASLPEKILPQTIQDIEDVLLKSPPCMQQIVAKVKHDHHLKNDDRIHLQSFFKQCGVAKEQQLEFWKANYNAPESVLANVQSMYNNEKNYSYAVKPCSKRPMKNALAVCLNHNQMVR